VGCVPGAILLIGANGLLGPYVAEAMRRLGPVVSASRTDGAPTVDLTNRDSVTAALDAVRPSLVVNLAALTDVDGCERDHGAAYTVNGLAVSRLVSALAPEMRFVQISTDQVYPDAPGPHREEAVGPINAYGASKLAGEAAALARPGSLVVRVNLVGPSRTERRRSLSDFFVDGLTMGRTMTLFEDVLFSPLHIRTLSDTLVEMVEVGAEGVYNLGARDGMSKAAFALRLAERLGLSTRTATLGRSDHIEGRARRPKDLRMDVSAAERLLGRRLPTLEEEIGKI
jgi:dTDP-4-dehydrorhamnose reductase